MNKKEKKGSFSIYRKDIHVIFLAIVLIIITVIVARFMLWNIGTESEYDKNNISDEFDTEKLDVEFFVDPSILADREDDGIQSILFLGNYPITDGEPGSRLPDLVADLTDATVYNGGFSGSLAASTTSDGSNPNDAFSLYFITLALVNHDFSFLENNLDQASCTNSDYAQTIEMLKNLDLENIDTLIFAYDGSDYLSGSTLWDPDNTMNYTTFQGALYNAATLIQQFYPHIRIIMNSPTYCTFIDENGVEQDGDTYSIGNGAGYLYVEREGNACYTLCVSFIDNYYGSIHVENYKDYLVDNLHLNDAGRALIAERIASFIH